MNNGAAPLPQLRKNDEMEEDTEYSTGAPKRITVWASKKQGIKIVLVLPFN